MSNRTRRLRRNQPRRQPGSVEQWVDSWRRDSTLSAEAKVVLEVAARHSYPNPDGGWSFEDTEEFYADAAAAIEYRRTGGRP